MSRSLPTLAVAAAVSMLSLTVHAIPSDSPAGVRAGHAAGMLPGNLCESCHGSSRPSPTGAKVAVLDAREVATTRAYLQAQRPG